MTKQISTVCPYNGEPLETYEAWSAERIEAALQQGHRAALAWGKEPLEVRVAAVRRIADELRKQSPRLAALVTKEMGKITTEAAGEVEKSAVTALYYAENAHKMLANEPVSIDGVDAWVGYEPIGLVLAVMPWNFPVWQVMRFAIPAITAGNGVLLKHSPNVTGCALALEALFVAAGLPAHLVSALVVAEPEVPQVIERLIADDRIAAATLTGSNRAGAAVGAAAGRASKRSVLELGGSDAFVVLDDADVPSAVAAAVKARFNNAGQSCVCAKRFIVSQAIADSFTEQFVATVKALRVGDPRDPATQMGPLARADLRDTLDRQVRASVDAGAVLLAGGKAVEGAGCFYPPTVLGNVAPGMAAFDEETFGPLAAIAVAKDDEDAIRLANATPFGLSISIWSASQARALNIAKRVTTGAAFINAMTASDARIPFGGTKRSGYGRELAAVGMREFTNIRTFWVAKTA
ncbi:NAD-dependent succinate-semialdehyde dehydrogenase [Pandoraea sp. XJJ-1]|uniref:NAD-dependent succinate-semialdehyde dehydrogenase n=1 Tax=Pandoraea sp. XJJ-1 TaxID=3002643 RepID=UPI00227ED4F3|nr:NAD-dependent succinate-semialdehyde dehydrogenase [Pandoraea sp. XJJ-1]WAL81229.1 NAD-dependent succinate-semialdehyde dehydrogenase [Pandoraea sp. XJJ-1]